eukprot:3894878-Amphidinium_carterae.1
MAPPVEVLESDEKDEGYDALKVRGWNTYSGLSFSTTFPLNQNEDIHFQEVFFTAIFAVASKPLGGVTGVLHGQTQTHHECWRHLVGS